jgi:pentatricopeptide repeat protein
MNESTNEQQSEALSLLRQAEAASNFDEALPLYGRLVEIDPSYLPHRGDFFRKHGRFSQALTDFIKYKELDPNDGLLTLGRFHFLTGNRELGLKEMRSIIEMRRNEFLQNDRIIYWFGTGTAYEAYQVLINCYLAEGDYGEAVKAFQELADLCTSYLRCYADFCQELNLSDGYLDALNKMVQRLPATGTGNKSLPLLTRARFFEGQARYELALKDYDQAVTIFGLIGHSLCQFSPLAHALRERSEFLLRRKRQVPALRDAILASIIAALFRIWRFWLWVAYKLLEMVWEIFKLLQKMFKFVKAISKRYEGD